MLAVLLLHLPAAFTFIPSRLAHGARRLKTPRCGHGYPAFSSPRIFSIPPAVLSLLSASAVETLRKKLLPQVALITPNLPEAAALLGAPHAQTEREMKEQGNALLAMGCGAVLMKGGHLDDAESPDWLFTRDAELRFTAPRVQTKNTHGTGCTLSAALAALRPRHENWADTVREAKTWLSAALAKADSLEVGHGIGPVHHFHAWW